MEKNSVLITKLNNENYSNWCYKIKLLMLKEDCWSVITEDQPNPIDVNWKKKNSAATVIIGLSVEDNQLMHIKNAKTVKEA